MLTANLRRLSFAALVALAVASACSASKDHASSSAGGGGASASQSSAVGTGGGSTTSAQGGAATTSTTSASVGVSTGSGPGCDPNQPDQQGCVCGHAGDMRPCWPDSADPSARAKGTCKDGTQTCQQAKEFLIYGPCLGAVVPGPEVCGDNLDNNCDGLIDCNDPACAVAPICKTGCNDGQTRACYDGPQGTNNVGTCHGGTQTCVGGQWPSDCPGEVLPSPEVCSDGMDHDCNHLAGCLDLFACILSPACQPTCKTDPGCVCPQGTGDAATCPDGMFGKVNGANPANPGTVECCPCTANDCVNPGCCGEAICSGNAWCAPYTCIDLPASCNGQVDFDCDDFPEDCDEPCCKCNDGMCP